MDGISFHTPDYDGNAAVVCRRLALPSFLWPLFNGAVGELLNGENWYQFGSMTVDDIIQAFTDALDAMTECFMIGSIIPFATNTLPGNVLPCDGTEYQRADYPLLYAVCSASLITSPDTFVTPDLRSRFVLGESAGRQLLEIGGEESHTLTIAEMPTHTHDYTTSLPSFSTVVVPDEPSAIPSASVTAPEGGGQPHNNMPPFVVLTYGIIAK